MKNGNATLEIYQYNPDIKILSVQRHPVERAYSFFLFQRQMGAIADHQFETAIKKTPSILKESLYYQQLKRYFNLFDERNIKVLLYDDIQSDRKLFLEEIYSFLGVKPWLGNEFESRSDQTKESRFGVVNHFISGTRALLQQKKLRWLRTGVRMTGVATIAEWIRDSINVKPMKKKPEISEKTKAHLADYFKDDIQQLEQLIKRDLNIWE